MEPGLASARTHSCFRRQRLYNVRHTFILCKFCNYVTIFLVNIRKFWTRNRPGDILKDVSGVCNALSGIVGTNSATITDESGTDLLKGSINDVPLDLENQTRVLEPISEDHMIEIPGLNDGHPGPLDSDDEEDPDSSKNRAFPNRPPGSISKEFMANWSTSRVVPKTGVVLSAVAAAKESSREATRFSVSNSDTLPENQSVNEDTTLLRSVSTPLVTSDMCMNPKAKAAASEAAEYDARFKGRKFDSAAREEEMLAFANNLMPPSPPHPLPQPPPPPAQPEPHPPLRPPANQVPPSRFGPPPQRFMGGPPRYPPGGGYLPPGPNGPPFRHPPMNFRPPFEHQWGSPGPYNGPPPPGYGGPPPSKRQAMQRPPPPQQMRRGW